MRTRLFLIGWICGGEEDMYVMPNSKTADTYLPRPNAWRFADRERGSLRLGLWLVRGLVFFENHLDVFDGRDQNDDRRTDYPDDENRFQKRNEEICQSFHRLRP
jgi:hypothetical protein